MKNTPFPLGVALLATIVILLTPPSAKAAEEIEYAYPDVSVWTTKRDEKGKLKNPLVCIADHIFKEVNIPWRPKDYPAARMFRNLRNGASKFSILVNASALKNCCYLSKKPVAVVDLRIFHKEPAPPIATREQMRGKRVIAIHGYSYGGLAKYAADPANGVELLSARNHKTAFAMLKAGRGDYVIDYAEPAREILETTPIENIASTSISQNDVFLILHKTYPEAEKVIQQLETASASIPKEEQDACWKRITEGE